MASQEASQYQWMARSPEVLCLRNVMISDRAAPAPNPYRCTAASPNPHRPQSQSLIALQPRLSVAGPESHKES